MEIHAPNTLKDKPRRFPSLNPSDIHVWVCAAESSTIENSELSLLPVDEIAHARKVESKLQRCQYVRGRILLRQVLSLYLLCAPEEVQFRCNRHGKPSLKGRSYNIRFNLTHSDRLVLIAVVLGGFVGIDTEILRDRNDLGEVARQLFSANEFKLLPDGAVKTRKDLFYRFWTGKEACVKAVGTKITDLGLKRIDLSRASKKQSIFRVKPGLYLKWFTPVPGFVAAIARNTRPKNIRLLRWSDSEFKS